MLYALFLCPALISQTPGVEGVVVDNKTGLPLQGVAVYFGTDKGPSYETTTDPSGQFRVTGMASGDYGCHFEKNGYISQYSGSQDSPLKPVHIAGGQDPVRRAVSLAAYSKLRGRVLDPEGKPVVHARLTLASLEETTDDEGRFAFSPVPPGSYTLKATPGRDSFVLTPKGQVQRVPGTPKRETPQGEERTELLPAWYPSAISADLAEPIVVRGGDDLFGIDIRLASVPVYRVRGKAFNLDGSPVHSAAITSFSSADLATTVTMASAKTGGGGLLGYFTLYRTPITSPVDGRDGVVRDGFFELASVPRGARRFRVTPVAGLADMDELLAQMKQARQQGVPFVLKLPAAAPAASSVPSIVSVIVDRDIDDLEIHAEQPIAIEAAVGLIDTPPDKTPTEVREASVTLDGLRILPALDRLAMSRRPTGEIVRFENVIPGEIRVAAPPGLAGGYYLASVTLGGQDITWKPVNVQAGSPPIGVIYKPNAGTVTGVVEAGDATEAVLIPQAALDALDVQYGRITPLGRGGVFELDSVGPGSYYAFAANRLQLERLANPAVAQRIASAATLVRVTEGATISVKLPLVRFDN